MSPSQRPKTWNHSANKFARHKARLTSSRTVTPHRPTKKTATESNVVSSLDQVSSEEDLVLTTMSHTRVEGDHQQVPLGSPSKFRRRKGVARGREETTVARAGVETFVATSTDAAVAISLAKPTSSPTKKK
mmetsp:Transcript_27329/g.62720  ORF Transcript_27329/g.62720 Transcript_27329/m.62720 type:complete len:131 (+) Transcript_27329:321-713(+)